MEIAASWPWATAQMMFLGPRAASPPKKTSGRVDCSVTGSTTGHARLVELEAEVALDPGERVLLAHATSTSSHSWVTSARPWARGCGRPLSSYTAFTFSKSTPVRRPSSCRNAFGTR
jgi:hypothetical protein